MMTTTKRPKIAILVQGDRLHFDSWYQLVVASSVEYPTVANVFFVYASYDAPILGGGDDDDDPCHNTSSTAAATVTCQTLFLPNSTWTQGRNRLAEAAYCQEQQQQQLFAFWIFADDDAKLRCPRQRRGPQGCWARFVEYLVVDVMTQSTTTMTRGHGHSPPAIVALPMGPQHKGLFQEQLDSSNDDPSNHNENQNSNHHHPNYFSSPPTPFLGVWTDTYDALLNAFARPFVPYLLPYLQYMPKNTSQWQSQMAQFWLMRHCFPLQALVSSEFKATNGEHRAYPRGNGEEALAQMIRQNYQDYYHPPSSNNDMTSNNKSSFFPSNIPIMDQFERRVYTTSLMDYDEASSSAQRATLVAPVDESCLGFAKRFEEWAPRRCY